MRVVIFPAHGGGWFYAVWQGFTCLSMGVTTTHNEAMHKAAQATPNP